MDVNHLAFEDQAFDAAVATFLFCVLPDDLQVPALREIGRVVKSGGTIRPPQALDGPLFAQHQVLDIRGLRN